MIGELLAHPVGNDDMEEPRLSDVPVSPIACDKLTAPGRGAPPVHCCARVGEHVISAANIDVESGPALKGVVVEIIGNGTARGRI